MEMRKEDRLSKLPNALIQHVLSFLPIKDVVSTGILSKRWRYVWVSTDVLDFRGWWCTYLDKAEGCCDHEMDQNGYLMAASVFLGFLERVLTVRDDNYDMPTLRKCYLEIDQMHFHRDTVEALVSTIVRRQVKELILDFHNDVTDCEYSDDDYDEDEDGIYEYPLKKLYFPDCFFTCESLTRLELNFTYFTTLVLPKSSLFPRLMIFKLVYVKFNDNDLLQKFFCNCPILEDLSLGMCSWKVVMDASKFFYCIPSLKILRMSDFVYEDMCFANVHVTSLPIFNNMKCLVLAYMNCLNIGKLFDFLHNSPNLESLVYDNSICHDTDEGFVIDSVPRCMFLHLKSVEFKNYRGSSSSSELYVLEYFLKNALVLQKMIHRLCNPRVSVDSMNKAMEKLLVVPRVSTCCKVELL